MNPALNDQLLKAIFQEDLALAKQYIQAGAEVNYVSGKQDTALLIAVDTMNDELVSFLLAQGANPNPDPAAVYTLPFNLAVDVAVQAVLNEEAATLSNATIELLLRHGADFTVKDQSGKNAVEMATNYNSAAHQLFEARLNS